jgi:dTDP-4-dehydrorhamnose 3,5-epimerase
MPIEALSIAGSFSVTPKIFSDDRGTFLEWFRQDDLVDALGHPLNLAQANWSTSHRGVIRGIHYANVPPGQAKYVTCVRGSVLDVLVDLRVGSPTFGRHETVTLDDESRRAVYLAEGLGHGFCALTDDATVLYLCSTGYNPAGEHGIHPLDPDLALPWPADLEPVLSDKDAAAPSLAAALDAGTLPTTAQCTAWDRALGTPAQVILPPEVTPGAEARIGDAR